MKGRGNDMGEKGVHKRAKWGGAEKGDGEKSGVSERTPPARHNEGT